MAKLSNILMKAQQYAKRNPDAVGKYADKAADFANKRTNGKYQDKIGGAVRKLDAFTGNDRRRRGDEGGQGGGSSW